MRSTAATPAAAAMKNAGAPQGLGCKRQREPQLIGQSIDDPPDIVRHESTVRRLLREACMLGLSPDAPAVGTLPVDRQPPCRSYEPCTKAVALPQTAEVLMRLD